MSFLRQNWCLDHCFSMHRLHLCKINCESCMVKARQPICWFYITLAACHRRESWLLHCAFHQQLVGNFSECFCIHKFRHSASFTTLNTTNLLSECQCLSLGIVNVNQYKSVSASYIKMIQNQFCIHKLKCMLNIPYLVCKTYILVTFKTMCYFWIGKLQCNVSKT